MRLVSITITQKRDVLFEDSIISHNIRSMRKTTFSDPVLCLARRSNNLYLYVAPRTLVGVSVRGCLPRGGRVCPGEGVSA